MKYTDKQIQDLLSDIHSGTITDRALPKDLYFAIADYLKQGLYQGFGGDLSSFEGTVLDTLLDLRENIYLFSGAKTFQFVKEAGDLLTDEKGVLKPFSQYKAEAEQLYGKYNESWLEAEHKTTIGQAQQAQRWGDIQSNKDILPIIKFSTNGKPCPICNPFEGLTAHADDKIWKIASPLLHFGCFCILESYDESEPVSDKAFLDKLQPDLDKIPEIFRSNPGETKEIFTKEHPYFDVPKEDKKFAKTNFGLPVPPPEVKSKPEIRLEPSFKQLNEETQKIVKNRLDVLTDEYPNAKLKWVGGKLIGGSSNTFAQASGERGFIAFNPKYFNDLEKLGRTIKESVDSNHFYKGTSVNGIIDHEFGHILTSASIPTKGDTPFKTELSDIFNRYKKALNENTKKGVRWADNPDFISKYSHTNLHEFTAESFAFARENKSASPYAKEVLALIDKHFK